MNKLQAVKAFAELEDYDEVEELLAEARGI